MATTPTTDNDSNINLWIIQQEKCHLALSIPATEFQHFSLRPLAWLRYLAGALYGQIAYLLDPKIMDERQSYSTHDTAGRVGFKEEIIARDSICIVTGISAEFSQACHIVPHMKGDNYLDFLSDNRLKTLEKPLEGINDSRNGLLLIHSLHLIIGKSRAAFLPLPNWAMKMSDIPDCDPRPSSTLSKVFPNGLPESPTNRLIFQYFPHDYPALQHLFPHNSDARISSHEDWPPPQMFDIAYAAAALKAWGQGDFVSVAEDSTRHYLETHVISDRINDDDDPILDDDIEDDDPNDKDYEDNGNDHSEGRYRQAGIQEKNLKRKLIQEHQCCEQAINRSRIADQAESTFDDVMAGGMIPLVLAMWQKNSEDAFRRARLAQKKRLREEVVHWRSTVSKGAEADQLNELTE
ncbi:hypothetical protein J132_08216 [Termitomyces sp. J132]|nr:hypothetical protein J132_08216 [Termitomyces sp. J132]